MILAFLLFAVAMLAVALFPAALPGFIRLLAGSRPFLRRHRRVVNAAFLVCTSLAIVLYVSGCAAGAFLTDLESVIPIALTGITGVLSILAGVDPALAPVVAIVTPIVQKIETNLQEAKKLTDQYKQDANETTLAQIEALVTTTTGDLDTLLKTDGLPAAEAAQIATIATAINSELQALISTLPVLQASTAGQTLTVTKPSPAAEFSAKIQAALPPAA
jgi:hypothetical protein